MKMGELATLGGVEESVEGREVGRGEGRVGGEVVRIGWCIYG